MNDYVVAWSTLFSCFFKGFLRREWLEVLPSTIAHEWAHMEQWRDGKPINHKGVDKRTRQLLKSASLLGQ